MAEIKDLIGELVSKGWTKAALAYELDMDRRTIDRWSIGETSPPTAILVADKLQQLLTWKRIPKGRRY